MSDANRRLESRMKTICRTLGIDPSKLSEVPDTELRRTPGCGAGVFRFIRDRYPTARDAWLENAMKDFSTKDLLDEYHRRTKVEHRPDRYNVSAMRYNSLLTRLS